MRKILCRKKILLIGAICGMQIIAAGSMTTGYAQSTATPQPTANPSIRPAEQPVAPDAQASEEETVALTPELLILQQVERELKEKYRKEIYIPPAIQSLILTSDQQSLLREARGGFNTRAPSEEEEQAALTGKELGSELDLGLPSVRAISLGGIVFINPDDWTIWLNKQRVTSSNLPKEAVDLRVYKDFIELRWFDAKTNKIFPIRLRPNQTFNLDAQTFIPG